MSRSEAQHGAAPSLQGEGGRGRLMVWGFGLLVAVETAWAMTGPLRAHETWLNFVQDDFFYYLKVAQEMAAGHGSTFNGLVQTNGYHPLWLLMVFAVERAGGGLAGAAVFVAATTWLATMATYLLSLRLLRRGGVSAAWASLLSAIVATFGMHLYEKGMEGTLVTPLMFWLLCAVGNTAWWQAPGRRGVRNAFLTGLLTSAMVLARLDALLFAGLLGAGIAVTPELRRRLRPGQIAAVGAGLLPVAAYFVVNRRIFGVWLPISGMAKELKTVSGFTMLPIRTVMEQPPGQWVYMAPVLVALAVLPLVWKRLTSVERVMATTTLGFMIVLIAVLSYISDWPIWYWYYYPLRPALCMAFVVLMRLPLLGRAACRQTVLAAATLLVGVRVVTSRWDEQVVGNTDTALRLEAFARSHPGVYAMGDRAGVSGLLLPYPVVQTEGLMMDKTFLGRLKDQMPLREALAAYHVRYYVATSMGPPRGCFEANEPAQGGAYAAKMRAEFCEPPVGHWSYGGIDTLIYDLQKGGQPSR